MAVIAMAGVAQLRPVAYRYASAGNEEAPALLPGLPLKTPAVNRRAGSY